MVNFAKKISLLIFFMLTFSYAAQAVTWQQYDEKKYIDLDSIEKYSGVHSLNNNSIYSFWTKILNNKNQVFLDDEKFYNKKIWYKMARTLIDCKNKTLAIKSYAIYDLKGQIIDAHEVPEYQIQWSSIIPETLGELYYNGICLP